MQDVRPDTWAALMRANNDDAEGVEQTIRVCSQALGLTLQQGAERFLDGLRNQRHEAAEVLSDDDLPPAVIALGERCAAESRQPITGIKRGDDGYLFYTPGNPILIEAWARAQGFRAGALAPSYCVIAIDPPSLLGAGDENDRD